MNEVSKLDAVTILIIGAVIAFTITAIIQKRKIPSFGLKAEQPFYSSYWFNLSVAVPFLFSVSSLFYNLKIANQNIENWHELVEFIVNENYKTSLGFLSLALILSVTVARFHHSKQQSETLASHQKNTIYSNAFQHRKEFTEMIEKEFEKASRPAPRTAHTAIYPKAFEGEFNSSDTVKFLESLTNMTFESKDIIFKEAPTKTQWRLATSIIERRFSGIHGDYIRTGFSTMGIGGSANDVSEESFLTHKETILNMEVMLNRLQHLYDEASNFLPTLDKQYTDQLKSISAHIQFLKNHSIYIYQTGFHLEHLRGVTLHPFEHPNIGEPERYVYPLPLEEELRELIIRI